MGLMAATWCFATFVFVQIYCSCLASYMSLTSQQPAVNSLKEFSTNPRYEMAVFKSGQPEFNFLVGAIYYKSSVTIYSIGYLYFSIIYALDYSQYLVSIIYSKVMFENSFGLYRGFEHYSI